MTTFPITEVRKILKPKRRWLQFSFMGIFLLIVLIALPLGSIVHKIRQQRNAVEALRSIGCSVRYLDVRNSFFSEPLRRLLWVGAISDGCVVSCENSAVTDSELVHLKSLPTVKGLSLSGTQVTDAGLKNIANLTDLVSLNLARTKITDHGAARLQRLAQLDNLDLAGTQVTDVGLVHLQGMKRLTTLSLDDTQVTDAGLVHLQMVPHLILLLGLQRNLWVKNVV